MIIPVVDSKPDGRKKGLRMRIKHIDIDDNGEIESMFIEYSVRYGGKGAEIGAMVLYPNEKNHYCIDTPTVGG